MIRALLLSFLTLSAMTAAAAPPLETQAQGASLTFGAQTITASGLRPGSTVVFFGIGRQRVEDTLRTRRWVRVVTDTDGDGTIAVTLDEPLPQESVWVVADTQTGDYATGFPAGAVVSVLDAGRGALRRRGNAVDSFSFAAEKVELLYVHPGKGAWVWREADGTPTDGDGPNGLTMISLDRAKPVHLGDTAPAEFTPGGMLFAVDPFRMQFLAVRVTGALIGGAR